VTIKGRGANQTIYCSRWVLCKDINRCRKRRTKNYDVVFVARSENL